jgi:hypothetical protein
MGLNSDTAPPPRWGAICLLLEIGAHEEKINEKRKKGKNPNRNKSISHP